MWIGIWLLLIVFCSLPPIIAEIIIRNQTEAQLTLSYADKEGEA